MTLPELIAALEQATGHDWSQGTAGVRIGTLLFSAPFSDRLALARALVKAEGYVVAKVPGEPEPRHERHVVWCHGFNACRAAMLAGRDGEEG